MKVRPVRTGITKQIVAFRNFANAPENRWQLGLVNAVQNKQYKTALFNHDGVMVL
jgi:hypothetical protein